MSQKNYLRKTNNLHTSTHNRPSISADDDPNFQLPLCSFVRFFPSSHHQITPYC